MPLDFFDANVTVGQPRNAGLFAPLARPADLTDYLDRQGLAGALIWHWAQSESHPLTGNALVQTYAAADPRTVTCWALLPPATREAVGLPDTAGFRPPAVRLFPDSHRYLLNRVAWGPLLDWYSELHVPVLLSLEHGSNWQQVYGLLEDFPRLTCVLCDIGTWSMDRYTYPLLEAYPNLHVETSMLALEDGGVEGMARRFGASRLVFGTGFPRRYAEAARLQLAHAELSLEERQAIAGSNLRRLLAGACSHDA